MKADKAAALEALVTTREENSTARDALKDAMAESATATIEGVKAKREEAKQSYEAAAAERQALLGRLLPAPPEPAEAAPAKGKKK